MTKRQLRTMNDVIDSMIGMHTAIEDPFFTVWDGPTSYPPYNIKADKSGTKTLELAVAGFNKDNLNVEIDKDNLIITGQKEEEKTSETEEYVKKGISSKAFRRVWKLGKGIKVNDVKLSDGILSVYMEEVEPDKDKVKRLEILT